MKSTDHRVSVCLCSSYLCLYSERRDNRRSVQPPLCYICTAIRHGRVLCGPDKWPDTVCLGHHGEQCTEQGHSLYSRAARQHNFLFSPRITEPNPAWSKSSTSSEVQQPRWPRHSYVCSSSSCTSGRHFWEFRFTQFHKTSHKGQSVY